MIFKLLMAEQALLCGNCCVVLIDRAPSPFKGVPVPSPGEGQAIALKASTCDVSEPRSRGGGSIHTDNEKEAEGGRQLF